MKEQHRISKQKRPAQAAVLYKRQAQGNRLIPHPDLNRAVLKPRACASASDSNRPAARDDGQGIPHCLGIQAGEIRHRIAGVFGVARLGGRRGGGQNERMRPILRRQIGGFARPNWLGGVLCSDWRGGQRRDGDTQRDDIARKPEAMRHIPPISHKILAAGRMPAADRLPIIRVKRFGASALFPALPYLSESLRTRYSRGVSRP